MPSSATGLPEIAVELLGKPTFRAGQEWRWGRKGSLAVVVAGREAGMWFDHEAGDRRRVGRSCCRTLGLSRREALDWTADRIGLARDAEPRQRPVHRATRPAADTPETMSRATNEPVQGKPASPVPEPEAIDPRCRGRRPRRTYLGCRAPGARRQSLSRRQAGRAELALRMDASATLSCRCSDIDGVLHSVETIAPTGEKRYLAGGAKRGHFCVVGAEPAPLAEPPGRC